MKKIIFLSIISLFIFFARNSLAADYSCEGNVCRVDNNPLTAAKIDATVDYICSLANGGTVIIPSTIGMPDDRVEISSYIYFDLTGTKNLTIQGAGVDSTILNLSGGSGYHFEDSTHGGGWFEMKDIKFTTTGVTSGIYLRGVNNFRIHHCRFEGQWNGGAGAISTQYKQWNMVRRGLIDHCYFYNRYTSGGYLISGANPWPYPTLSDFNTYWNTNYDKSFGMALGDNAIYIEDNEFDNDGATSIVANWNSWTKYVIRYNTFGGGGSHVSNKAGNYGMEAYGNHFYQDAYGGDVFRMRTSGIIHSNYFHKINPGVVSVLCSGFGHVYARASMYKYPLHLFNNDYSETNPAKQTNEFCQESWPTTCEWGYAGEGIEASSGDGGCGALLCGEDSNCIADYATLNLPLNEGNEILLRSPQPGDAYYPYIPYIYPHPLASGGETSVPTAPAGLTVE